MKVQHPIQHTLASFSAFVPLEGSLRVERYGSHEYVCGEYEARRQVFVDYFRASSPNSNAVEPHILFARSGDAIDDILRFTEEWGPLAPNGKDDGLLTVAFDRPLEPTPENYFAFYVANWRNSRKEFVKALNLIAADQTEAIWELLPYRQPSMGPVKRGAIYPYIDRGTDLELLERLWTADGRMTKKEVWRIARELGIFAREKRDPKYRIVYEAVSLMDAFWHMLFRDLTDRKHTVRICANVKCRKPYIAHRTNQKHCTPECAKRAANLNYYHYIGAAKRREARLNQ